MDIELIEIRDFLASHPPFDALPEDVLATLPKRLTVRYLRRGSKFPPDDEKTPALYILRRGAIELRDRSGELIGKLAEGDTAPSACDDRRIQRGIQGTTSEDSLIYLLPCEVLGKLRAEYPDFAAHFDQSVSERLRSAIDSVTERGPIAGTSLMTVRVRDLIGENLVSAAPETSIEQAARIMSEARCSSLIIMDNDRLRGLLTVRDLRDRCLAAGLSPQRPVSEIMTQTLHTTAADTLGFQALLTMSRLNVHHLPVMRDGQVVGVISTSDLVRFQSANSVYLVGDIHKAEDLKTLVATARKIPELQIHLVASGATADQVGQAITAVTDAINLRLIELAERDLGPPPFPYCWMVGGSQARREQSAHSDQDNALLLAQAPTPEQDAYFQQLAAKVTNGLNDCGFVHCPGDVMASNPQWRQPLSTWRNYFEDWIERPQPQALLNASVFFDLRALHDPEHLFESLQREILRKTSENRIFIAHMAANAIKHRPPLGFFRNFVLIRGGEHDHTFDLKLRGTVPIIDMARVHALSAGIPDVNSLERLQMVAGSAALSRDGAANLVDALEFIGTLRVRHQANQLRAGEDADNFLSPDSLSPLERGHMKDAFALIASLQETLGQRYQAGRFS
jgi:CBS domain-containing protein